MADSRVDLGKINRTRMARDLKVDISHVSRIFSKRALPSLSLAHRMAAYLGVTLEELCEFLGVDGVAGLAKGAKHAEKGDSHGNIVTERNGTAKEGRGI